MESETEVKMIQINLMCPDCEVIMKSEVPWVYRCHRCNSVTKSEKHYPYIKYVPKNDMSFLH